MNEYSFIKLNLKDKVHVALFKQFYTNVFVKSYTDANAAEDFKGLLKQNKRLLKTKGAVDYCVILATDRAQQVCGGLIADIFPSLNVGAIEFLVVEEKHRRKGVGRKLVAALMRQIPNVKSVFIEVEDPADLSLENKAFGVTRLKILSKLGAKKINLLYIQPPLNKKKDPVDILDVFQFETKAISNEELLQFFNHYFTYCFACKKQEKAVFYKSLEEQLKN